MAATTFLITYYEKEIISVSPFTGGTVMGSSYEIMTLEDAHAHFQGYTGIEKLDFYEKAEI
jgi:hypothetical protein